MTRVQKKDILILARASIRLYCSALAELLAKSGTFHVHFLEENARPLCGPDNPCDLIVFFPGYPILASTARIAKLRGRDTKLLMILGASVQSAVRHVARLDVDGIIPSDVDYDEFLRSINTLVFKKLKYISPSLIASLTDAPPESPFMRLSKKELDVALIATNGKRNVDIAAELNISPKTVNTYKSRIFKKLGITNDMQLLRLVLENKSLTASGKEATGHTKH
jgi:two-component system, NarL family, invasion response regulator UvrY